MYNNAMTGTIPTEITQLTGLEELWVVDPFRAGEFTPTRALPHCSGVRRGVYLCEAWVDVAM
eukprot:8821209-Pyramimonas_sp.AAC.2